MRLTARNATDDMLFTIAKSSIEALRETRCYDEAAVVVKRAFDEKFGFPWICVIGRSVAGYVAISFRTRDRP